jgi:hypothetical protein
MKKYNIKMVDGLGDKIRSSSDLTGISKWKKSLIKRKHNY